MTLNLAAIVQRITRRDMPALCPVPAQASADPFDRLARIVRVERAREAVVLSQLMRTEAR